MHLITWQRHEDLGHAAGTNQIALLSKFWIIAGCEPVRVCKRQRYECQPKKANPAGQQMAALPAIRLKQPLQAFPKGSADYDSPFTTIQRWGRIKAKRYLYRYTCLLSKAAHLEM